MTRALRIMYLVGPPRASIAHAIPFSFHAVSPVTPKNPEWLSRAPHASRSVLAGSLGTPNDYLLDIFASHAQPDLARFLADSIIQSNPTGDYQVPHAVVLDPGILNASPVELVGAVAEYCTVVGGPVIMVRL
ncbi:hypothetical protein M427DRAFT_72199 [Gonapodya prolifera JEL478]|uniref:Uncharacterized protein n=1 Tax=Gonapodya prolifera (strain JEL478) TaxID=1344416 RepID=A0A139A610_GONPJ|nr:hypothetical protein M427DRAFT_72199 [Gonapodya prolifera JEL478]|eukprot:KXS12236.1 hypothetical protein M427DRAFT_72199 [Gonapodya prolifera JEL478]